MPKSEFLWKSRILKLQTWNGSKNVNRWLTIAQIIEPTDILIGKSKIANNIFRKKQIVVNSVKSIILMKINRVSFSLSAQWKHYSTEVFFIHTTLYYILILYSFIFL
jgi:hypothetical protein